MDVKRWWGRLLCRWGYHDRLTMDYGYSVELVCRRCEDSVIVKVEREKATAWKPWEDVNHLKRLVERLREVANVAVAMNQDFTKVWQCQYDLPQAMVSRFDELWFVLREADLSIADMEQELDGWLLRQREAAIERDEEAVV